MRFDKFILFVISSLFTDTLLAQNLGPSPYSAIGIGDLAETSFSRNQAMGGAGVGLTHAFQYNSANPASLASLKYTNFEFGVAAKQTKLATQKESQTASSLNLTHMSLSFPLHKRFITQIGAKPFSTVNYEDNFEQQVNDRVYKINYNGSGGLSEFFWGNAFEYKNWLFIGLKSSIVTGQTIYDFTQWDQIGKKNISSIQKNETHLALSPGLLITKELKKSSSGELTIDTTKSDSTLRVSNKIVSEETKNWHIGFGLTGSFFTSLKANEERYYQQSRYQLLASGYYDYVTYNIDTTAYGKISGYQLPSTMKAGLSLFKPNKVALALDYSLSDWSTFSYSKLSATTFVKQHTIALGGEYIPDFKSIKYYKRIAYRAGFNYKTLPYKINNQSISQWQATFGASFALSKSGVLLNPSISYGQRGTTENSLYKENFWQFNLSVISSDRWFIRRKHE